MELEGIIPSKPNSTGISEDLEISNGSMISVKDISTGTRITLPVSQLSIAFRNDDRRDKR